MTKEELNNIYIKKRRKKNANFLFLNHLILFLNIINSRRRRRRECLQNEHARVRITVFDFQNYI